MHVFSITAGRQVKSSQVQHARSQTARPLRLVSPTHQVTDRLATTGLLMVLSKEYPEYFYHCMGLVLLDIASHWLQMYSQLLTEKKSHKDVDTSAFFLLR